MLYSVALFPAVGLALKADRGCLKHRIVAVCALALIVLERSKGGLAEDEDDRYVYDDHECLEHIGCIPYEPCGKDSSDKNERRRSKAEDGMKVLLGLRLKMNFRQPSQ